MKPAQRNIPIKTERDVQRRLKIEPSTPVQDIDAVQNVCIKTERGVECRSKKEVNTSVQCIDKQAKGKNQQLNSASWNQEKQSLVNQIVELKSESHHNLLNLKKVQAEHDEMLLKNQRLEQKMFEEKGAYSTKIKEFEQLLSKAKNDYSDLKANCEKNMSDLKRENKSLLARVKQYQTGLQQNPNQVYEVESILNHKETKNGRLYLIRWDGYGSDDDTWEKAENLECPKLLAKYTHSIKNNRQ